MSSARDRRQEREGDEQAAAAREPEAASTPVERVLALQRTAGNAAVTAALKVARSNGGGAPAAAPPDPRAVAVHASSPAAADRLTLADFDLFVSQQVDWASQPSFAADRARSDELRAVLDLAHDASGAVLSACGSMPMRDLRPAVRDKPDDVRWYGRAVESLGWETAGSVREALQWGEVARKLVMQMSEDIVRQTVKQGPEGSNVRALVAARAVDDFVNFVATTNPLLTADNGMEVTSYLRLRAEGNPLSYAGQVGDVRNLHHFTKGALDALKRNVADTSRSKPLAVVLHSTVDHNGAFHRDPNMTAVLASRHSCTLLIEGASTLADAGTKFTGVVASHGQGTPPRARQVMLAGHGNARVTELAGDRDATGQVTSEAIDLDANQAASIALIDTLIDNLDTDPSAQIVLNGCLTASSAPTPPLSRGASAADRAQARTDLAAAIAASPSLADTIRTMGAARQVGGQAAPIAPGQVSGALSSFGSEVTLIDPRTGQLGLRSPDDPMLTTADKFEYVRQAGESTGAMRAVVECLLADEARTVQAMRDRLARSRARTDWDDKVIKAMYNEALADPQDLAFINLMSQLSGPLSELQFPTEARPGRISWVDADVLDRVMTRLEGQPPFSTQTPPLMKVVVYQVWMQSQASKQARFLSALSGMTVNAAQEFVDVGAIQPLLGTLLPNPAVNAAGELRLALLDVVARGGGADAASIGYLRRLRTGAQWTNAAQITTALGGASSASAVLTDIREPQPTGPQPGPQPAGPPDPDYNMDLDGDGRNDTYVEPMVTGGMVIASAVGAGATEPVFARPDTTSTRLGDLADGASVRIIGRLDPWYAIEFGPDRKPGFIDRVLPL